jgi:hypothetical protein
MAIYISEVMQHVGFSQRWIDWTFTLLSMTSTRVCLNGAQGTRICHPQGLRQGDSLLPMLFVLVMEVLDTLIRNAEDWAIFDQLGVMSIKHRMSLYANDFTMFLFPTPTDLELTRSIL